MSMKISTDTSWDFFLLFSFVYMDSFDVTEQVTLLTRFACGCKHVAWRGTGKRYGYVWLVWAGDGVLVCFSQVGAPSYCYSPVHLLGLGTTSYGLPFMYSCTFRHFRHNSHVVYSTVRKFVTLPRLLGDWYSFHLDRLRKSIRSCNVGPRRRFSRNVTKRDSTHSTARCRCGGQR